MRSDIECPSCSVIGTVSCEVCLGTGRSRGFWGLPFTKRKCAPCDGTGRVSCTQCNGTGSLSLPPNQLPAFLDKRLREDLKYFDSVPGMWMSRWHEMHALILDLSDVCGPEAAATLLLALDRAVKAQAPHNVALAAISGLVRLGYKGATADLVKLTALHPNHEMREAGRDALAAMKAPAAVPLLLEQLLEGWPSTTWLREGLPYGTIEVAEALVALGVPAEAADHFVALLGQDYGEEGRVTRMHLLAKLAEAHPDLDLEAVLATSGRLSRLVCCTDPRVHAAVRYRFKKGLCADTRIAVCREIGEGRSVAHAELLMEALAHPDAAVSESAALSLIAVGEAHTETHLAELGRTGGAPEKLAQCDHPQALEILLRITRCPDADRAKSAVRALGTLVDRRAERLSRTDLERLADLQIVCHETRKVDVQYARDWVGEEFKHFEHVIDCSALNEAARRILRRGESG